MAVRHIDLTGLVFDRLTVIEKTEKPEHIKAKRIYWKCICVCGNEIIVDTASLRTGNTRSCGCLQKEMAKKASFIDLTGQIYGRWTVLFYSKEKLKWFCRCECGTERYIQGTTLRDGESKSCGCGIFKETVDRMVGKKFEKLLVLYFDHDRKTKDGRTIHYWLCKCDCGTEKVINGDALVGGNVKSCGCLQKSNNSNKLKPGEAAFNALYGVYKRRASLKKLDFELNKSEFLNITNQNCYYCGGIPRLVSKSKNNGIYVYNTIDRLDSSMGYTLENCVPACNVCNIAKMSMGEQDFYSWISRVYTNLKLTNRIN